MPDEPTLALAVSARDWPDRLRQSLADHGGARVRLTALGPVDLDDEHHDVLFIDDICSFLTRWLVTREQATGRLVVGVFDPAEPQGREHLENLGVDLLIASSEPPEAFVNLARSRVSSTGRRQAVAVLDRVPIRPTAAASVVAVRGVSGGVGVSEIALGLTLALPDSALLELAPFPSLAQRMSIDIHPNLASAIEFVDHGPGDPSPALQRIASDAVALVGVGDVAIRPTGAVRRVVESVRSNRRWVIVDEGQETRGGMPPDHTVVVTLATPVGIARCLDRLRGVDLTDTHVVVNRAPLGTFERAELLQAVLDEIRQRSVTVVPEDVGVSTAAWNGQRVGTRRYLRAIEALSHALRGST